MHFIFAAQAELLRSELQRFGFVSAQKRRSSPYVMSHHLSQCPPATRQLPQPPRTALSTVACHRLILHPLRWYRAATTPCTHQRSSPSSTRHRRCNGCKTRRPGFDWRGSHCSIWVGVCLYILQKLHAVQASSSMKRAEMGD